MTTKTVDEFLISDWIEAMTHLNQSSFNRLKKIARSAGIEVPAFVTGNSKPVIRFRFEGESETEQYHRVHDKERVRKFRKDLDEWAKKVEKYLRSSILTKKRKYRKHSGEALAESLSHKIHLDKTYRIEPRSIGFKFARHGVYWAKGAYRGHAGLIGSKWTDSYGRLKVTNPESLGMIGIGKRRHVDWFNPVIDSFIGELADIAVAYCGDMTLDLTRIHIR